MQFKIRTFIKSLIVTLLFPVVAHADNDALKDIYLGQVKMKGIYEVCSELQNSSHRLAYRIDASMTQHYEEADQALSEQAELAKQCSGITEERAKKIMESAVTEYKKSPVGQMNEMATRLGPHNYVSENDAYERVRGCNGLSQALKNIVIKYNNEPKTCEALGIKEQEEGSISIIPDSPKLAFLTKDTNARLNFLEAEPSISLNKGIEVTVSGETSDSAMYEIETQTMKQKLYVPKDAVAVFGD